jgi:uncharacterized membrane protein YbhN (UPF0104 family)
MKSKDIFQYILGALIVAGFFVLLYLLISTEVPEKNTNVLNLVIGALIGSFTTIVGYFYGSSKGSSEKTELLSKKPGDTL